MEIRNRHLLQLFAEGGDAPAEAPVATAENGDQAQPDAQQQFAQRRMEQWDLQARRAREVYPGLDLAAEARDPRFVSLLRRGLDVESAYTLIHRDQILTSAMRHAARVARQQLSSAIQSGGSRPMENGVRSGSGAVAIQDVAHMTRSQRDDIRKRAARGERIRF